MNWNSMFLIFYLSDLNGTSDAFGAKQEYIKVYAMAFPAYVLLGSSCYLRALLVLLRLLAVKRPMNFETAHQKISRIGSIIVWTFSLLVYLLIFGLYLPSNLKRIIILTCHFIALYIFDLVPVLSTMIMYVMFLRALKIDTIANLNRKSGTSVRTSDATMLRKRSLAKMTRGVAVCLAICNLPFIAWFHYDVWMLKQNQDYSVNNSVSAVKFLYTNS